MDQLVELFKRLFVLGLCLRLEILSTIVLSFVLNHMEFIPSGEPINRSQKKRQKERPIKEVLQNIHVQPSANILSTILSITGYESMG